MPNEAILDHILAMVRNGKSIRAAALTLPLSTQPTERTVHRWLERGRQALSDGRASPLASFAAAYDRCIAERNRALDAGHQEGGAAEQRASLDPEPPSRVWALDAYVATRKLASNQAIDLGFTAESVEEACERYRTTLDDFCARYPEWEERRAAGSEEDFADWVEAQHAKWWQRHPG